MMRRFAFVVALATAMVANACGGTSLSPTAPSSTVVGFAPALEDSDPPSPAPVAPSLPSTFEFVNVTNMSMASSDLPLWGLRGGNTSSVVKQMVFGDSSALNNPGLRPLYRFDQLSVKLNVSPELVGKMYELELVATAWSGLTGVGMTLTTSEASPFSVEVGQTDGYGAITRRWNDSSGRIVKAAVIFRSLGDFTLRTMFHELGHVAGLYHYLGPPGALSLSESSGNAYGRAELDNVSMMMRLAPGTSYPGASDTSLLLLRKSTITEEIIVE